MSIFNRENFNFGWTSYYKRVPKGEDIPVSIGDGIQIETIYGGNEPVEVRLSVPEPTYVEKSEGYFYRNPYGYETPVELEGVEIERNITQDSILVKGGIEPTYRERQAEIEDLMEKIESSSSCSTKKVTHIWGKQICEYSQSELLEHLKRIWRITQ